MRAPALALLLAACDDAARVRLDPTAAPTAPALVVTAEDITNPAGAQTATWFGRFGHGRACAVADLDLDGLPDLVVGHPTESTFILRNVSSGPGDVRFEPGGVFFDGPLTWNIQPADYDDDGDLDVFFGMGGIEGQEFDRLARNELIPTGTLRFTDQSAPARLLGPLGPNGLPLPSPTAGAAWGDLDRDGDVDLFLSQDIWPLRALEDLEPASPEGWNNLYINNGDGTFTERGRALGLDAQEPSRHSVLLDYDEDGDLDIYENNYSRLNVLWRNRLVEDGALGFEDVTEAASLGGGHIGYPPETFVSAAADVNQDGYEDLVLFVRGYPSGGPHTDGHVLLLNVRGQGFVDASEVSKLNNPFDPGIGLRDHAVLGVMGSIPADLTGNGIPDVMVGNGGPEAGHPNQLFLAEGVDPVDFGELGTLPVPRFANHSHLVDFPVPEDPAVVEAGVSYPPYPYRTHALCVADYDHDGRIEVFVTTGGTASWGGDASREPDRLFRFTMDPPQRWLQLRPVGDGARVSRDAIGTRATVRVVDADGTERAVYNTLRGNNGFSSSNVFSMFFGLGVAERIVSVEVRWPDGERTVLEDVEMDQVLEVSR